MYATGTWMKRERPSIGKVCISAVGTPLIIASPAVCVYGCVCVCVRACLHSICVHVSLPPSPCACTLVCMTALRAFSPA